ncbi:hypothetical protein HZ99_01220 [Pseudomonas fluorescens]|nr:hypothetical protein HZ99_01220 [Pseudomonas fluorescens]
MAFVVPWEARMLGTAWAGVFDSFVGKLSKTVKPGGCAGQRLNAALPGLISIKGSMATAERFAECAWHGAQPLGYPGRCPPDRGQDRLLRARHRAQGRHGGGLASFAEQAQAQKVAAPGP